MSHHTTVGCRNLAAAERHRQKVSLRRRLGIAIEAAPTGSQVTRGVHHGPFGSMIFCGDGEQHGQYGIGHDQGLARPLDVAQHRHRHRDFLAAAARRDSAAAVRCGQQPAVPVLAPQQQVHPR